MPLLLPAVLAVFPAPFHRTLRVVEPPLQGPDVTVLQQLLRRINGTCALACGCGCSHRYDAVTAKAVACYANRTDGVFTEPTAHRVLAELSSDGWVDDGVPASATGHLYKLLIPVHRNRSVETTAALLDANNVKRFSFRVRAHGHDVDASGVPVPGRPWPDFSSGVGLNQFSTNGNTPTGLYEVDLNSPESSPQSLKGTACSGSLRISSTGWRSYHSVCAQPCQNRAKLPGPPV